MGEVKFVKVKMIGDLTEKKNGWTLELNLVSWNDGDAKYDIRSWSPEGKPGRGVTLTSEELKKLRDLIITINL